MCVDSALGFNLSKNQQDAIETDPNFSVTQIIAGPGAGKTEVLALRVIFEVMVRQVESKKIIVTTFTRKAAEELIFRLSNRTEQILEEVRNKGFTVNEPNIQLVRVGTIHSLCDELLTDYDPDYVEKGLQLIDEKDARMRLMRYSPAVQNRIHTRMDSLIGRPLRVDSKLLSLFRPPWKGIQGYEKWPKGSQYSFERAGFMLDVIGMASETSLPRSVGLLGGNENGLDFQTPSSEDYTEKLEKIPDRWLQHLKANHAVDFTTIQVLMWRALQGSNSPFKDEFDHIFVDEFQDTNPIQLAIHSRWPLINSNCLLTVVGDEDQSMYRFRGSDIACFTGLPGICKSNSLSYQSKFLEINYRSTPEIVDFSQAFRFATEMHTFGKAAFGHVKRITAPSTKKNGKKVRAIIGSKEAISEYVAKEIAASSIKLEENAILMFSTKESNGSLPQILTGELQKHSLKVHNPTAKMAWQAGSDMRRLLAALVYFFDPPLQVGRSSLRASRPKPAGKLGGVDWSIKSHDDWDNHMFSSGVKYFPKEYGRGGKVGSYDGRSFRTDLWTGLKREIDNPSMRSVRDYLDKIRGLMTKAIVARNSENAKLAAAGKKIKQSAVRVTIGDIIYRILSHAPFNQRQFDYHFLRQVLFTQMFDANVSSTRLTRFPLDDFIWCEEVKNKIRWPAHYWDMLEVMHRFCNGEAIADLDSEAFQSNAVSMMTFHASKGLEFKHVYVLRTGRGPPIAGPLRAKIFSGEKIEFDVIGGHPQIKDTKISNVIRRLAKADRDREVYVAMTRAEDELTFVLEKDADFAMDRTHEALLKFIKKSKPVSQKSGVDVYELNSADLLSEFVSEVI